MRPVYNLPKKQSTSVFQVTPIIIDNGVSLRQKFRLSAFNKNLSMAYGYYQHQNGTLVPTFHLTRGKKIHVRFEYGPQGIS